MNLRDKLIININKHASIYNIDKKMIGNFIGDLTACKYERDLIHIISKRYESNDKVEELKSYSLVDLKTPLEIVEEHLFKDNFYLNLKELKVGDVFSTIDICILADNYNQTKGMYKTTIDREPVIIIKAQMEENDSLYSNNWIKDNALMNYYFEKEIDEENHTNRLYSKEVNKYIYYTHLIQDPIRIYVFTRKKKKEKYSFRGVFKSINISKNGKYFTIKNTVNIDENDVMIFNESSNYESNIISDFTNDKLYSSVISKNRLKQGVFREAVINFYEEKCLICNIKGSNHLIASHIKPYRDCNAKEATDVFNGFLLCPLHDHLFDKGYVTILNGKLIVSEYLKDKEILHNLESLDKNFELDDISLNYLQYHYNNVFLK